MTDQADLERGYRRLLAWYPREFRRENGQEILAVLMAGARDGQRRPGLAESADLIRSGVWMRLRPSVPRSARTVQAAVRLMCAGAAVSAVGLIIGLALIIVDITAAARGRFLGHSLTALANGSQHGYGIIIDVREISGGRVRLRAGTLYSALDRLRADELIGVDREEVVDGRLRRYYRLTPAGTKRLAAEAARLQAAASAALTRLNLAGGMAT